MDRTQGANYIVADGKRQFTDGPPGTTVEEVFLNSVQEELMSVIEGEGYTPSSASDTQLYSAIVDIAQSAVSMMAGRRYMMYRSNTQTIVSSPTGSLIIWSVVGYSTINSVWSIGAPTKFYVPDGVTQVCLRTNIGWATTGAPGERTIVIYKNGTNAYIGVPAAGGVAILNSPTFQSISTAVLDVSAGDYFEVLGVTEGGGSVNLYITAPFCWFEMDVIK